MVNDRIIDTSDSNLPLKLLYKHKLPHPLTTICRQFRVKCLAQGHNDRHFEPATFCVQGEPLHPTIGVPTNGHTLIHHAPLVTLLFSQC